MSCLAITPSAAAATANSAVSFPMTFAVSYSAAVASVQAPPSPTDSSSRQSMESGRRCDASIAAVRGRAVALARQRASAAAATAAPTTQHRQQRARKSVKFAMDVDVDFTHPAEDYDRSSLPMAKLNFRDFAELLQIRASIRRQAEETLMEATQGRVAKGNLPAMQARGIVQC